MIENSTRGLTLLDPDREVVVTREEHHQRELAAWAPRADGRARRVAVELCFAPITHGTHAGRRGIEARLDGRRVGELTFLMSQRYGPLVDEVLRSGGRPACVATVDHGRRGLVEVELRLPEVPAGPPPPTPAPPPRPPRPDRPDRGRRDDPPIPLPARRSRKPYLIGAGVVAVLLIIGAAVNNGSREQATTDAAAPPRISAPAIPAPARLAPSSTPAPLPPATDPDTARDSGDGDSSGDGNEAGGDTGTGPGTDRAALPSAPAEPARSSDADPVQAGRPRSHCPPPRRRPPTPQPPSTTRTATPSVPPTPTRSASGSPATARASTATPTGWGASSRSSADA